MPDSDEEEAREEEAQYWYDLGVSEGFRRGSDLLAKHSAEHYLRKEDKLAFLLRFMSETLKEKADQWRPKRP